jgi:hypothetical protein
MKLIAAALAFTLLGFQQGKAPKESDISINNTYGIAFRRPPKNDEWDFKEKGGFFSNSHLVVVHKVDQICIEIFAQDKATGFGGYDIKDAARKEFQNISGFQGITEAKQITVANQKLPGGGAGNVNASFLEMTFKKEDKPMEMRIWVFIGKNQNLFKVMLSGDEGMYKKHQKVADYILASIETFKPK